MTRRPTAPPGSVRPDLTSQERAQIESVLGALPEDLLHAVRDGRGPLFQRLEFVGDAVLELVVRLHAEVAGASCPECHGVADSVVTDAALARAADTAHLDRWLEWSPSRARRADLVEACAGAVWLARGWVALAEYAQTVVHPLAPVLPEHVRTGWDGAAPAVHRRSREVLGASVIEVAAATLAYRESPGDEGELTVLRNRYYAAHRVVERAADAGVLDATARAASPQEEAERKDEVDRFMADLALRDGLESAVADATKLLA